MKKKTSFQSARRGALRGLASAPALAAGAAVAIALPADAEPVIESTPEAPENKGYHDTPHIRAYYRTAGF